MTVDIAMLSEAQRRAIVEAKTFMRHGGLCGIVGGYGYCTCGMDEAVAALDATTPSVLAESTSNDCLLVAEAVRERCAGVAERFAKTWDLGGPGDTKAGIIAATIRSLDLSGVGVG